MKNRFAENLKAARLAAGLTQKEVAERVGVAKSTYSLYESGKRAPVVKGIKQLAKALGVTADELLGLPEPDEVAWLTADDTALLITFHDLNTDGRARLLQYAEELTAIMKYQKKHEEDEDV